MNVMQCNRKLPVNSKCTIYCFNISERFFQLFIDIRHIQSKFNRQGTDYNGTSPEMFQIWCSAYFQSVASLFTLYLAFETFIVMSRFRSWIILWIRVWTLFTAFTFEWNESGIYTRLPRNTTHGVTEQQSKEFNEFIDVLILIRKMLSHYKSLGHSSTHLPLNVSFVHTVQSSAVLFTHPPKHNLWHFNPSANNTELIN